MTIDRVSDIENLIKKGAHVIVNRDGCYINTNPQGGYKQLDRFLPFPSPRDNLKSLVRIAANSKTTITIRNAGYLDIHEIEDLLSIGDGSIVLDFSTSN
jgi:hypothetical protein